MTISDKIAYASLCDSLSKNNYLQQKTKQDLTNRAFDIVRTIDAQVRASIETDNQQGGLDYDNSN